MSLRPPQRQTVLFSGHDFRFLRPFIAHCEANPRYRLLFEEHAGHEIKDDTRCREFLPLADVVFCEWCLGNAVWYSRHKLPHQRLVIRLHLQEMRLPYLDQINWANVDALILICPLNLQQICERYPFLRSKAHLIYNPIDCQAFNQPKLPGAEFNLGIMGIAPRRKGPHLAFEIFSQLRAQDSRFTLFVKGRPPRDYDWVWRQPEERAYYEAFYRAIENSTHANSVVFESYGEDVPLWFTKIGFVLSTSDFEGSHQSVAEGMAAGTIPIIRDWAGADMLYPRKYVASTVAKSAAAVLKWRDGDLYATETQFCRRFARENFDQAKVCQQTEALFSSPDPANANPATLAFPSLNLESGTDSTSVMILCYLRPGYRGGYLIRIAQEIAALRKLEVEIHLACLHPETPDANALDQHRRELETFGCAVHLVAIPHFFDIQLPEAKLRPALTELEAIVATHQLRIVQAEALYCARIGLLLRQQVPGLRLVFDCHGTTPEEERMGGGNPARIAALEEWEHRILAGADLNVFVSEAMQEFYRDRYALPGGNHVVVPCCIADERFASGDSPSPLSTPADRPTVVYLGTLAAWQCGEEMIRLFAQLRKLESRLFFLLLVPGSDHAQARKLMAQYHLPESSVLLTELPHHEVAAALPGAHVGVLLRRKHIVNQVSSPTKFGEYLAAGLPVLMTEGIGDFSQLAQARRVGLVLESRLLEAAQFPAAELERILEFIRTSHQKHSALATRCQTLAGKTLHWNVAAAELLKAYRRLLGTRPVQGAANRPPQGRLAS